MFTLMAVLGLCVLGHCILGRPQPEKHSIPAKIETGYQYAKPSIGGKPLSTFTFEDFPESPRSQHASPLSPTWDSSPLSQRSQNQKSAGQTRSNSSQAEEGYQYAKPAIGGKSLSTFTFEDFPESPRSQHASPLSPTWDRSTLSQTSQNQSSAGQTRSRSSQAEEGYQYDKPAIGGKALSTFTFEDFPESPRSQPSTLSPTWDSSPLSQRSQNQKSAGQTRSNSSQTEEGYQYAKPAIGGKSLSTFTFEDFPESPRSQPSTLSPTWDSSPLSQRSQNQKSAGQTRSNSSQTEEGYQYAKPAIGGKSLSTFTFEDFPESPRSQPSTLSPTWDSSPLSQKGQNQSSAGQTRSSSSQAEEGYQYDKPAIGGKALSTFTFEDFPESPRSQPSTLSPTWDSSPLSQRSQNQKSAGQTRSNSSQTEEGYQYAKPAIGGKSLSTFTFEDFPESPRSQPSTLSPTWDSSPLSQKGQNQSSAGQTRSSSSQAEEGYQYEKPGIGGKALSTFTFEDFPESPRSQDASTLSPTWDSSSLSQRSQNQSSAGQTRSNSSQAEEGYQYEKPGIGGKALSTFTFEDFLESPRSQSQRSQNQSSAGYTRSNSSQAEEGYQYDKPAIVGKTMSTFTFEEFPGYI